MKGLLVLAVVLATSAGLACAPHAAPPELVDARAAYARAHAGAAVQANVEELRQARTALEEAERKFTDDPSSPVVRHLAYLAHRKVLLADANARAAIARSQRQRAEDTLMQIQTRRTAAP